MYRRIIIFSLVLALGVSTSGCLLVDNSVTLTVESKQKIKVEAEEITEKFFAYNEYDSNDPENNYRPQKLINMFKEKRTSSVLTIDPIIGPKYDKSYSTLKKELKAQKSLFQAQDSYDYKLLFEDKQGDKSYKIMLDQGYYTNNTATYDVLFQVFEQVEGRKLLTDNGIITFQLEYIGKNNWLISHLLIDYRDLGSIDLGDQ